MALELRLTDQKFWQISPYLAEYLAVKDGEKVSLYVGRNSIIATVFVYNDYSAMELNRGWAVKLGLAPGKWGVRRTWDGIRLGPIIGIVCNKLPSRPPARSNWRHYLEAFEGGQGVLLTPEGFDLKRGKIHGLTMSKDKLRWVEEELPWPDSLYVRTYPVDPSFRDFLQREFPYSHFNTHTLLNKWTVYQILSAREDILPYLPDTTFLNEELGCLQELVQRSGAVFLKPCFGHKGRGVLRISADNENYQIEFRQNEQNCKLTLPVDADISKQAGEIFGNGPYIVQQALNLTRGGDSAFDFRALMQKQDDGLWHITGLWGRRGASGSIVTNVASGGEAVSLSAILNQGHMPKSQRIKEIFAVCFKTAMALDESLGMLGEIGLDLCIDNHDRLWILEVNGMPGKNAFPKGSAPKHNTIYASPMHYASYLSGFAEVLYPLVRD